MKYSTRKIIVPTAVILLFCVLFSACGTHGADETTSPVTEAQSTASPATERETEEQTSAVSETADVQSTAEALPGAEYRLDAESAAFSCGESFSVVLSVKCEDFCSGCCFISFDKNVLTCTNASTVNIDGVNSVIDTGRFDEGIVEAAFYSLLPVDVDYSRAVVLDFTVNDNVPEDTRTSVAFSDGTICIVGTNADGTEIDDITYKTDLSGLEITIE